MWRELPNTVVFLCDDAAVLSPMCAALFMGFEGDRAVSLSAASKELVEIHPLARKICGDHGVGITNHRRVIWSDELLSEVSVDLIVALTPAAQHVALEATRSRQIDVEYWPLQYPDTKAGNATVENRNEFVLLIDKIQDLFREKLGITSAWEDVISLPNFPEEQIEAPENSTDDHLSRAEKVTLVKRSLQERKIEISHFLNSLKVLIEERIILLESNKPNDPVTLEEWKSWMDFLRNLLQTVMQLARYADEAVRGSEDIVDLAAKTQNTLDVYKRSFSEWPRENAKEVVDGTYRLGLVGFCGVVGTLFGQPLGGALIGAAVYTGPKFGKAIGEAIKSGISGS